MRSFPGEVKERFPRFDTRQGLWYSEAIFSRKEFNTMRLNTDFSLETEFEKIRSLPKDKRWEYIWEYYRMTCFLWAFFLFFLFAIGSFLMNGLTNILFPKEPFSIAFAAPGFSNSQVWMEKCLNTLGYDEKKEEFRVLSSAPLSDTTDDFRINASVWMANGQPDIFIVNESSYRYLLELDALAELQQILPEHLKSPAADRQADAFTLDISDTPMAEAYGLTEAPVYLCMYLDGSGFQRALHIVEYILTES